MTGKWLALSLIFAFSSAISSISLAANANEIRGGLILGNTFLSGEIGDLGGRNSVSFGAKFGFFPLANLEAEFLATQSKHDKGDTDQVSHNLYSSGLNFYALNFTPILIYVNGGVAYIDNKLKSSAYSTSDQAFALYAGLGFDFEANAWLSMGMDWRFLSAFDTEKTINGATQKTVQDSWYLLAHLNLRY